MLGAYDGDGRAGYLKFSGGEHIMLGGTEGNDTLSGGTGPTSSSVGRLAFDTTTETP